MNSGKPKTYKLSKWLIKALIKYFIINCYKNSRKKKEEEYIENK